MCIQEARCYLFKIVSNSFYHHTPFSFHAGVLRRFQLLGLPFVGPTFENLGQVEA